MSILLYQMGSGGGVLAESDPHFANVSFLSGFEGIDAGTSASDDSPVGNTINFIGNAELDSSQSRFGTTSVYCPAGDHGLLIPRTGSEFQLGSGDWTFETWARAGASGWSTKSSNVYLWSIYQNSVSDSRSIGATMQSALSGDPYGLICSSDGSNFTLELEWDEIEPNEDWVFLVWQRSGNTLSHWQDGALIAEDTYSSSIFNTTAGLCFAGKDNGAGGLNQGWDTEVWFDETRLTKGVARYTAGTGLAVPTQVFPRA